MRRSTLALGLMVTAGVVITVGSGWRAQRSRDADPAEGWQSVAQSRMGGTPGAGYSASQWAERNSATKVAVPDDGRREGEMEGQALPEPGVAAGLPWLRNFAAVAEATTASPLVVERMAQWRAADDECSAAAYGGLSIMADVVGGRGAEEVLASFTQGVLVLDAKGKLLASATAPECQGSADDLLAIAVGDAHIDGPVIAMAVTTGGHRASTTWLVLYRVIGGVVAPVWSGAVEEHVDDRTRVGDVTLLPGALLYQAPSGKRTLWTYSAEQGRYGELMVDVPAGA